MGSDLANRWRPSTSLGRSLACTTSTATLTTGLTENFITYKQMHFTSSEHLTPSAYIVLYVNVFHLYIDKDLTYCNYLYLNWLKYQIHWSYLIKLLSFLTLIKFHCTELLIKEALYCYCNEIFRYLPSYYGLSQKLSRFPIWQGTCLFLQYPRYYRTGRHPPRWSCCPSGWRPGGWSCGIGRGISRARTVDPWRELSFPRIGCQKRLVRRQRSDLCQWKVPFWRCKPWEVHQRCTVSLLELKRMNNWFEKSHQSNSFMLNKWALQGKFDWY